MRKLLVILVISITAIFNACNPTTKEIEFKRIADSIRVADSLAMVQAKQQLNRIEISQEEIPNPLELEYEYLSITKADDGKKVDETRSSDTNSSGEGFSSKDSKLETRRKIKKVAKLDGQKFGELTLFDEYFNDVITKYYLKDKGDEQRNLTIVIYKDRIRYMKILLQHVGNTSPENIARHFDRINNGLKEALRQNIYQAVEKNYVKYTENGETWFCVWMLTESNRTGTQDYWYIMVPEADFEYLKYMVKSWSKFDGFKTKFLPLQ